jgi:hypothetical protein
MCLCSNTPPDQSSALESPRPDAEPTVPTNVLSQEVPSYTVPSEEEPSEEVPSHEEVLPEEVHSDEVPSEEVGSHDSNAPDAAYLVCQEVPSHEALSQAWGLAMTEVSDDVPPQGVSSLEVHSVYMPSEPVPLRALVSPKMMMMMMLANPLYHHRCSTVFHAAPMMTMMTTPTNCLCSNLLT